MTLSLFGEKAPPPLTSTVGGRDRITAYRYNGAETAVMYATWEKRFPTRNIGNADSPWTLAVPPEPLLRQ